MPDILSIIYNDVKKVMSTWKTDDIYAISFFVYDKDDNPSTPTLTVGYNTMAHAMSDNNLGALSPEEAKWNYAFWLQNQEYTFGYDSKTAQLIQDWVSSLELSNEKDAITETFVNVLVEVSLKLHNDNVIIDVFGKEIPIIIHELEYYEAIATQNKRANPEGAIAEFLQWMDDEVLNPRFGGLDKLGDMRFDMNMPGLIMNKSEFDTNMPKFDMDKFFENEIKILDDAIRKMAESGLIPADRWKEYQDTYLRE